MNEPIVIFSAFHFKKLRHKYNAFTMMQLGHALIKNTPGLLFYKLLGSGSGKGFRMWPDFSTYAFLGVWESETYAQTFFNESAFYAQYKPEGTEELRIFMKPYSSHGLWDGANPFAPPTIGKPEMNEPIGVITRGLIKRGMIMKFWKKVPQVSNIINHQPGKRIHFGIGEWPGIYMATFTLWDNEQLMKDFAYKTPQHSEVVKQTRQFNWFAEELFARFKIVKIEGSYKGKEY